MIIVREGMTLDVTAGETLHEVLLLRASTLNILAGGATVDTTTNGGAVENVLSGGGATATQLKGAGQQIVHAGGIATGTRVFSGSTQLVQGGLARDTVVIHGGQLEVRASGILDGAIIESGADLLVEDGTLQGTIVIDGRAIVQSGLHAATLSGRGWLDVGHGVELAGINDITGDVRVWGTSLVLSGTGTFPGRLLLAGDSEARLTHAQAAGNATVVLEKQGNTLRIDGLTMPGNIIEQFNVRDVIVLPDLAWDPAGTVAIRAGNVVEVTAQGGTYALNLDPSRSLSHDVFRLAPQDGGTALTVFTTPAPDDFNADGTSDVLLQAPGGGLINWLLEDAAYTAWRPLANPTPLGYRFVASGDFNGDGDADIMIRHLGDPRVFVAWTVSNGHFLTSSSGFSAGNLARDQEVVATGDVTGDGVADLLMEAPGGALGSLQMGPFTGRFVPIGDPSGPGYRQVGTGDFNRDGTTDILLGDAHGNTITWVLENGSYAGWSPIGNPHLAGYGVLGTGDFNDDGTTDILLANAAGNLVTWMIEDGAFAGWAQVGNPYADGFRVLRTGDYDGDGTSDILLANADGWVVAWSLSEGTYADWHPIGHVGGYSVL